LRALAADDQAVAEGPYGIEEEGRGQVAGEKLLAVVAGSASSPCLEVST
jgi:hypothetical protein